MSKLLINEYPIAVLPSLAKAIGLNEAIVLQQVHYWLENPKAGVWHDGRKWIHNTYTEWQENFPFWSVETVKRTINDLEKSGLLVSAQFAPNPFDKTKSYTIQYDLLDEVNLTPSITETTVSDINNTASGKNQPSAGKPLPVEWQIAAGEKQIVLPDEKESKMQDSANLIAIGMGVNSDLAFAIAYTFMSTRGIIIPAGKCKAQRKAVKEMIEMGVQPEHVQEATRKLLDKRLTVTDLFSVAKTATDLANPPEEHYEGSLDGV